MRRGKITALFLAIMMISLSGCVDQNPETGAKTSDSSESMRIVSTSVAVCEILDLLEAENIVGIPKSAAYQIPERFAQAMEVGSPMSPDMEILSTLNADLIISPKSLQTDLEPKYKELGADYYFMDLSSVDGMYSSIKELGEIIGKTEQANSLYAKFDGYTAELKEKLSGYESKKVLVLMGLPGSYVVATENSYVGYLVGFVGGENIYAGEGEDAFININVEDMLSRRPDVILLASHAMPDQVRKMFEEEFAENEIWQHFEATQNGQVFYLDSSLIGMSATLDYPKAVNEIFEILYSEQ